MRACIALVLIASCLAGRASADDATPTFARDVAPIVFEHCSKCHRPQNVGPFSLLTYQDARKRAKQLARVTAKRTMPPWLPHEGWGEFRDARKLTDRQIAVIKRWADAGAPEGDPKDQPPTPRFKEGWQLGEPDIVLKLDRPFAIPAEGRDVYHHFVFPLTIDKDIHLRGIEVLPGNRRVAHHAVGILDSWGTARKLAAKHDGVSYPGAAPGFLPAGFTPGYAPGQGGGFFGDDEAITIKKGTDFVLQMHYSPSGKAETDQTEVGLYLSPNPPKRGVGIMLLGATDIDIPPGEKSYRKSDQFVVPSDYEVRTIWAHMHLIGKRVKVWAKLPDATTRKLLWIDDWDFNWQDTYTYAEPFVLPKGTLITAEFEWDNSSDNPRNPSRPPKRVLNGEQSADEMGGLIIGGRPVNAWDELATWAAVIGHYFEVEGRKKK